MLLLQVGMETSILTFVKYFNLNILKYAFGDNSYN